MGSPRCGLDSGLRQHLGTGGVGPGVGCAARPGQGAVEWWSLGPSGPGWAGGRAQRPCVSPGLLAACPELDAPCWDRDLESCVGNGAEALAASTATLGSYGKGPSESCTKALSVGCVSGWEQRGPLVREYGGRSRIRTQQIDRSPRPFPIDFAANLEQQRVMVEAFKEFALGWSRAGACCAPERTPQIPAQGRACACPWQSRGRAVSADPAGWAGGKTTSWHKRLRFVFGAKFESAA